MGYIYKITNLVNGKVYIGQTRNTIAHRFGYHKRDSKTSQQPLYLAMRKYGLENFVVEEIEQCDNSLLNEREIYWVAHFNSANGNNGYNATKGGNSYSNRFKKPVDVFDFDCNYICSYESIEEASNNTGVCKDVINHCCSGKGHYGKNYIFAYKGEKPRPIPDYCKKKPIHQYDLNGNYIKSYSSITQAEKETGIDYSHLTKTAKGKQKIAGGYQWSFEKKDNIGKYIKTRRKLSRPHSWKEVFVYDLNGNFIESFSTISECDRKYKVGITYIGQCCRKKKGCRSARGVQFSFEKNDKMPPYKSKVIRQPIEQLNKNNTLIKIFSSMNEAGKKHYDKNIIKACCDGKRSEYKGFIWKYAQPRLEEHTL